MENITKDESNKILNSSEIENFTKKHRKKGVLNLLKSPKNDKNMGIELISNVSDEEKLRVQTELKDQLNQSLCLY